MKIFKFILFVCLFKIFSIHQVCAKPEDYIESLEPIASSVFASLQQQYDPIAANPKGKYMIFDFFDYNCLYCKKSDQYLESYAKNNPDYRLIHKHLPILAPDSLDLAALMMAIYKIHKNDYLKVHELLMSQNSISYKKALAMLNTKFPSFKWNDIETLTTSSEIIDALAENLNFANKLNIQGIPAYAINGYLFFGYIRSTNELADIIQATNILNKSA